MKISRFLYLIFITIGFSTCEMVEYSPNVAYDHNTPSGINERNITSLLAKENFDDTIRIAFMGDSQDFYESVDKLVDKVNTFDNIDFLIHSGDISDFGLLQEFEWIDKIFSRLKIPYITVIGNHDLQAQGKDVYRFMYGKENFSFVYDSVKFIFHNTNGREYNFNGTVPDINFLQNELQPSPQVNGYIAVSHVPPFDMDFDKQLEQPYSEQFRNCNNFIASLHGHRHNAGEDSPYFDGVRYINSSAPVKRHFLLLEIVGGNLTITKIDF